MTLGAKIAGLVLGLILVVVIAGSVAGCSTTTQGREPAVQIQRVEVPVIVKCGSDPGPDPQYADTSDAITAAADIYERVKKLLAGRDQRDARLAELKASSAGCH